ncbi:glycosyltransferase family 4 protein [Proteiniphilum sp.]|uniref:glycosyltransferase family 4 protein n=1 Tax=Proteiniphilum sp. TaxID=1926877 RepID=UPI002B1FDC29|nr:glycosyltransferase family 4 protein [Proteiniphilum sp.]MEA4915957.1 glycosyltransferase family 4 protein [Proteiniphilum sp.]
MKIAVLTSGILPIPAFEGGAVENLIDSYLEFNEKEKLHEITVFSVINKKIPERFFFKKYTCTHYHYVKTDNYWYRIKRKAFGFLHKKTFYYHFHIEYFLHKVLELIKKQEYDIIILENRPGYAEKVAKTSPKSRIVLHLHNDLLGPDTPNASHIKSFISSTIAVSDYIKNRIDAVFPFKPSYTCHNGIDLEIFQSEISKIEIRRKLKLRMDDFVVVFSGRLIPEKGVKELLKAMQFLKDSRIKLLIIGGNFFGNDTVQTDFIKELQDLAKVYIDRIIFTGYRPYNEIPDLLRCADVGIIPSLWEDPCPLSCIEALAAGLPLIVTRSGGIPELINDECAIVLDKTSNLSQQLAKAIDYLFHSVREREYMSLKSLERSKSYSKEIFASSFFKLLSI